MYRKICIFVFLYFIVNLANGQVPKQNVPNVNTNTKPAPKPKPKPTASNDNVKKPTFSNYNKNTTRDEIGDWLLTGCTAPEPCSGLYTPQEAEYPGYDGFYNNIAKPDLGAIDRPLLRRWPAAYEDGTYAPSGKNRPNPLTLSQELLKGNLGTKSVTGKNALIVFFGQQVVEEILDAQRPACPPEYFNIPIPEGHTYRVDNPNHTELPLLRTRYDQKTGFSPNNPRQQLNEITPYLDGGLFYGTTKQWADQLRKYENGTIDKDGMLASSSDGLFPAVNTERLPMANPPPPFDHALFIKTHETAKVSRYFKLGNPRGNENSFLLTFGIMWFRWHNYLAKKIRAKRPEWESERVFNEARKWVIATQQNIVIYEWLKEWTLSSLPDYEKYDPSVDPQIDQFFQSAAFRFGHTLVVPGVYLRDYTRNNCGRIFEKWRSINATATTPSTIRTCNSFWRPYIPIVTKESNSSSNPIDIDRILMGMSVQLCEEEDHKIVEDLRGNVFGPLEFPRRDLMAVNIQRGRDHGLPDFNTARKAYGLAPVDFNHYNHLEPAIKNKFMDLYKNKTDDLDIWVAGILETNTSDRRPGEFFRTVILDQFSRIRNGDRFWFENSGNNLFTMEEMERIRKVTIYDIIMTVTKMDPDDIPKDPFNVAKSLDSTLTEKCKLVKSPCRKDIYNEVFDCYHLPQLDAAILAEDCIKGDSYDYFSKSEVPFVLTFSFVVAFIGGCIGLMFILVKVKENDEKKKSEVTITKTRNSIKVQPNEENFVVQEWIDCLSPLRYVVVAMDQQQKSILIKAQDNRTILRCLDFSKNKDSVPIYEIGTEYLIIKCHKIHNYDFVMKFESGSSQKTFLEKFRIFLEVPIEVIPRVSLNAVLQKVVTKQMRQKNVEKFYRVVFAQAFKIKHKNQKEVLAVDEYLEDVIDTELTIIEFAEQLNMRPTDEFVVRMFKLIDKDNNKFISFREFVGLLIIFADGTEKEKARLLFDMYDVNGVNKITEETFLTMIKSFLATVGGNIPEETIKQTITGMIQRAQLEHKREFYFEDFLKILGNDIKNLSKARLNFKGHETTSRDSYLETARHTIENIYESQRDIQERFQGNVRSEDEVLDRTPSMIDKDQEEYIHTKKSLPPKCPNRYIKYLELKSQEIFWFTLYTLVLLAIFAERAYYYSVEREHSGLRRIAGYGVTITRGAASAMMFTYSTLLVTMCRNLITYLRDTCANKYFPFDASIQMHRYVAYWAFIFTLIHIIGHAFNFYQISTQTADDLTCLFRNVFHATHELPKFQYWCWQTITGVTGVILTLIWAAMYTFAQDYARRNLYAWFWPTHQLYPLFYVFLALHGAGRLIQPPFFHYFFLGPVILFAIDQIISISRKKIEIPVIKAEILPSGVTMLEIRKPENFTYKSGQWIRLACLKLNKSVYHPFTISSAPHEPNLTVHIRAVGPWTNLIRQKYQDHLESNCNEELPKIYIDGPFGEGHQDWNSYDISVLIAGGIGVTPFASILKDIVQKGAQIKCKKVYFMWISKTQNQFEWMIDLIREIEARDIYNKISCHIFITQIFEKFDLRTQFLYICERHYQRVSNRSLFTNLKAVTHFGRPSFVKFFKTLNDVNQVHKVGVFSCGPSTLTRDIDKACGDINKRYEYKFEHHFKNF